MQTAHRPCWLVRKGPRSRLFACPSCLLSWDNITDSIDFGRKRDAELFLNRFAWLILTNSIRLPHQPTKPFWKTHIRHRWWNPSPHGRSVQELRRMPLYWYQQPQRPVDRHLGQPSFHLHQSDGCDWFEPPHTLRTALFWYPCHLWWWTLLVWPRRATSYYAQPRFSSITPEELFHQYFRPAKRTKKRWLLAVGILETHSPQECFAPQHR